MAVAEEWLEKHNLQHHLNVHHNTYSKLIYIQSMHGSLRNYFRVNHPHTVSRLVLFATSAAFKTTYQTVCGMTLCT